MTDFIAMIYEWFGYGTDLGDHLRGRDITCDTFNGPNLYLQIFIYMILVSLALFALMYLVIDKITIKFNTKLSWWIIALVGIMINLGLAYSIPGTVDQCDQLIFHPTDLMLYGIANAVWGFFTFILLTSFPFPRNFSTSAKNTTFWKP